MLFLLTVLAVLLLVGVPIGFSLAMTAMTYLLVYETAPLNLLPQQMFTAVNSFPLMAIPFFLLSGELMSRSGITVQVVKFCNLLVGRIQGGLAHVSIVAGMFFAGVTGSGVADAAAIGSILIPGMIEDGFEREYSGAVSASAAVMGPIIPPSIAMIIYGSIMPVSVGAMFAAGFVPGVMIGLGLMAVAYVIARRRNHPRHAEPFSIWIFLIRFKDAFLALVMPGIILGGILGGVFTPTEAGAVAVAYALLIGFAVYHTLTIRDVGEAMGSLTSNWILILLFINLFLLFMGCIMETVANILILAPVLAPLAIAHGIHPLHIAMIIVVNLCVGLITPPVGVCLYVVAPLAKVSLDNLVRAIWPFLLAEVAVLLLITYIPELTLFIPRLFGFLPN
jgi:TRAP-type C4-dicarboxylate transport system permease large subunit